MSRPLTPTMDRTALVASTACFLLGFAHTMHALGARVYRRSLLNFFATFCGFLLQTVWLYQRGQTVGRCPLTTLFDVLVFLGWSVALIYMATGATYRLSLLGALTSPLVFLLQASALLMPMPVLEKGVSPVNPWLEFHAAVSVVAYGAFALAGIAGVMLLVQERQLKTHKLHSFFFHLPPIHDLATANRRLLYFGFALLTAGLLSGLRQGMAHVNLLRVVSISIWLLYAFLCIALGVRRIAPRRASWLAIGAFAVLLLTVWTVQIVSKG